MIVRFDIEQHSIEWFEVKWGKIGGTRANGLFINSDTLFYKILAESVELFDEDFEEGFQNEAMERGNLFEPQAREELKKYTEIEFLECGWLQSEESKLLGISPDGITKDLKIQCEIKCPQPVAHLKMCVENEVQKDYLPQIIHAFTVNESLEKLYFCSYRPECEIKPLFIKEFTRDSVIDLGWKTKVEVKQYGKKGQEIKPKIETVSDCKTIQQWTSIAIDEAVNLELEITKTINKLNF